MTEAMQDPANIHLVLPQSLKTAFRDAVGRIPGAEPSNMLRHLIRQWVDDHKRLEESRSGS